MFSIGTANALSAVPYISVSSALSVGGRTVRVLVLNKHVSQAVNLTLSSAALFPASGAAAPRTLAGATYAARELFANCSIANCQWCVPFFILSFAFAAL